MQVAQLQQLAVGSKLILVYNRDVNNLNMYKVVRFVECAFSLESVAPANGKFFARVTERERPPWRDGGGYLVDIACLYPFHHELWRRIRQNAVERERIVGQMLGNVLAGKPKRGSQAGPLRIVVQPRYDLFLGPREGEARAKEERAIGRATDDRQEPEEAEAEIPF